MTIYLIFLIIILLAIFGFLTWAFYAGIKDNLIDVYETVGKPKKVHDVCLEDDKYFEGGITIGSPYFQYQIMEKLKGV